MSNGEKEKGKEAEEITLEGMLNELPIPDKYKTALINLFTNMAGSIAQSNQRLAAMEAKAAELDANPKKYEGMTPDQVYQIEMAKAAAPAAAAQQQLFASMLTGRGNQGGIDSLVKNAEALNSLRTFLMPPLTSTQMAMEKAQVSQVIAQTRLMNKMTGKTADKFLEDLEKELAAGKEE